MFCHKTHKTKKRAKRAVAKCVKAILNLQNRKDWSTELFPDSFLSYLALSARFTFFDTFEDIFAILIIKTNIYLQS